MRPFKVDRGEGFYRAALSYAQSLWVEGKPAQAVLQLNKAWSADLSGDEDVLDDWPAPYRALHWILEQSPEDGFLGNPVRHFQHLATRMSGPRAEIRIWRAWACFHLSKCVLDEMNHPVDSEQIEKEGVEIPAVTTVSQRIVEQGWRGESSIFGEVLNIANR